jgi:alpha-beta hydrolase superfamily lysophospholipase
MEDGATARRLQRALWWRVGALAVLGPALVVFLVSMGLAAAQDLLLFPGTWRRAAEAPSALVAAGFAVHEVTGADGVPLRLVHRAAEGRRAILHVHGNAELVGDHARLATLAAVGGWDWVAVELRGYGGVAGWPSEAALADDVLTGLGWIEQTLGVPADEVVLHGRSMGGGVVGAAVRRLGERQVAGVVLESTFDALTPVVAHHVPLVPAGLLLAHRFDTAEALAERAEPVWIVHGTADPVVPFARHEALAAALPRARTFVVEGGVHSPSLLRTDPAAQAAWGLWLDGLR